MWTSTAPVDLPESVLKAASAETLLTQWWLVAIVGSVSAAATAGTVVLARSHRSRRAGRPGAPADHVGPTPRSPGRWSRWGRRTAIAGTSLAWLLTGLLAVNSWYNMVPDFTGAERQLESLLGLPISYRTLHGGHVRVVTTPAAPELRMPASDTWVYTPPDYDDSGRTRYPVVYLIHGYPGTSADWFALGRADLVLDELIKTGTIPPVIVVAPDVNGGGIRDGECLDSTDGPQVETWLYRTLVPSIDADWPTRPDAGHRILGGFSAGGFCALDQGLRHPDTWGAILALEAYGDPGRVAADELGYDDARFEAVSPSHYIPTMTFVRPIPVYLYSSTEDGERRLRELESELADRDQPLYVRTEDGGHNWAKARSALPYGLVWAVRELDW